MHSDAFFVLLYHLLLQFTRGRWQWAEAGSIEENVKNVHLGLAWMLVNILDVNILTSKVKVFNCLL